MSLHKASEQLWVAVVVVVLVVLRGVVVVGWRLRQCWCVEWPDLMLLGGRIVAECL
jgi:hypothetical protein